MDYGIGLGPGAMGPPLNSQMHRLGMSPDLAGNSYMTSGMGGAGMGGSMGGAMGSMGGMGGLGASSMGPGLGSMGLSRHPGMDLGPPSMGPGGMGARQSGMDFLNPNMDRGANRIPDYSTDYGVDRFLGGGGTTSSMDRRMDRGGGNMGMGMGMGDGMGGGMGGGMGSSLGGGFGAMSGMGPGAIPQGPGMGAPRPGGMGGLGSGPGMGQSRPMMSRDQGMDYGMDHGMPYGMEQSGGGGAMGRISGMKGDKGQKGDFGSKGFGKDFNKGKGGGGGMEFTNGGCGADDRQGLGHDLGIPKDAKGLVKGALSSEAVPGGRWDNDENTLFVGGLPSDMTNLDMYQIFAAFGPIAPRGATAVLDKESGKCTGIGFVNFMEADAASKATRALHGFPMPDGWLTVKKKRPSKDKDEGKGDKEGKGGGKGGGKGKGKKNGGKGDRKGK